MGSRAQNFNSDSPFNIIAELSFPIIFSPEQGCSVLVNTVWFVSVSLEKVYRTFAISEDCGLVIQAGARV